MLGAIAIAAERNDICLEREHPSGAPALAPTPDFQLFPLSDQTATARPRGERARSQSRSRPAGVHIMSAGIRSR